MRALSFDGFDFFAVVFDHNDAEEDQVITHASLFRLLCSFFCVRSFVFVLLCSFFCVRSSVFVLLCSS
jgi:hypothetical protein